MISRRAILLAGAATLTTTTAQAWQPRSYGIANGYLLAQGQGPDPVPVAPSVIRSLAAGTTTSTTIPLTWSAPVTGYPAPVYEVDYRLSGSSAWIAFATGLTATSATITSLAASTAYDLRVTPSNASGTGSASVLTSVSTSAASVTFPVGNRYGVGVGGLLNSSSTVALNTSATLTSASGQNVINMSVIGAAIGQSVTCSSAGVQAGSTVTAVASSPPSLTLSLPLTAAIGTGVQVQLYNTWSRGSVLMTNGSGRALTGLYLTYGNFSGISGELPVTNNVTYSAALEYPVGTVVGTATWSGAGTSSALAPGARQTADLVVAAIPNGAQFRIRTVATVAGPAMSWPLNRSSLASAGDWAETGVGTPNALTATAPAANANTGPVPYLVQGVAATVGKAVAIIGDSRVSYTLDTTGDANFMRAYVERSLGNGCGWANYSRANETLANWLITTDTASTGSQYRRSLLPGAGFTHAICQLGINDLPTATSAAQFLANLKTFWTYLAGLGMKVYQTTFDSHLAFGTTLGLKAVSLPTIAAGGTGYPASSTFDVTISGGTLDTTTGSPGAPTLISVTTNGSGVVTTVNGIGGGGTSIGYYTTAPSGTVATTAATGSGLTLAIVAGSYAGYLDAASQNIGTVATAGQSHGLCSYTPSSVSGSTATFSALTSYRGTTLGTGLNVIGVGDLVTGTGVPTGTITTQVNQTTKVVTFSNSVAGATGAMTFQSILSQVNTTLRTSPDAILSGVIDIAAVTCDPTTMAWKSQSAGVPYTADGLHAGTTQGIAAESTVFTAATLA